MAAQPYSFTLTSNGVPATGQAAAVNAGATYFNATTLAAVTTGLPTWAEAGATGIYGAQYDAVAGPPLLMSFNPSGSLDANSVSLALLADAARIAAVATGVTVGGFAAGVTVPLNDAQAITDAQAGDAAALTAAGVQASLATLTTALATVNAALPGIPAATVAAVLTHAAAHGLTIGQTINELADPLNDTITNTWNVLTHVLTTVYSSGTTGVPDVTTTTQYPATQVLAPPVLGRTTTLGTIPQP